MISTRPMKFFFCKLHAPRATFMQDMTPVEMNLMREHAAYLGKFAAQGTAVVFGPVADPAGAYGMAVWELPDDADIHAICAGDPTIKSGLGFRYEVQPMPRAVMRDRLQPPK
jgi:uncharacterized protein YciI